MAEVSRNHITKIPLYTYDQRGFAKTMKSWEFANREMANIVLSIDGRKEVNDRMRPLAGGRAEQL